MIITVNVFLDYIPLTITYFFQDCLQSGSAISQDQWDCDPQWGGQPCNRRGQPPSRWTSRVRQCSYWGGCVKGKLSLLVDICKHVHFLHKSIYVWFCLWPRLCSWECWFHCILVNMCFIINCIKYRECTILIVVNCYFIKIFIFFLNFLGFKRKHLVTCWRHVVQKRIYCRGLEFLCHLKQLFLFSFFFFLLDPIAAEDDQRSSLKTNNSLSLSVVCTLIDCL